MDKENREQFEEIVAESPIQQLLAWDGNLRVQDTVVLPQLATGRPRLEVTVRSLSSEEFEKIRKQATTKPNRTSRRMGITEGELDIAAQRRFTLFQAIVDPDLSDSQLQMRFNGRSKDMTTIVERIMLPGELIDLTEKIMELSGIREEDENNAETVEQNSFLRE